QARALSRGRYEDVPPPELPVPPPDVPPIGGHEGGGVYDGAELGAGAGFGAAGFGAALAFGFAFLAAVLFPPTPFFLPGGCGFFRRLPLLGPRLRFLRSLRHDRLPIVAPSLLSFRQRDGRCRRVGSPLPGERLGFGASGRPVGEFDGVDDRDHRARSDL